MIRYMSPEEIERKSFQIIKEKLGTPDVPEGEIEIIMRVAHATADIEFAQSLIFHPQAVKAGILAIKYGKNIITDVEMVKVGIRAKDLTQFGGKVICLLNDNEVVQIARKKKITRAAVSMEKGVSLMEGAIIAIGNAPTALLEVCELIKQGKIKPALIIGIPVGFVGAEESKKKLRRFSVPFITNEGPRGGSAIAVSIVNALIRLALKEK
ncbi:MAG TPA: precorrin-8X methylmutase [Candidatus Aerophobetes bacterium]|uniref:Precorrin-8X methylmutase n=1 Tax=Aerophobetes bacterium TaxID=2030807 RepID=A0A662DC19_UNCAE|nr:MAG: precorrin-8X methylmutase [Candidatus Aerophobetes bacterium]HDN85153.1 precorrin-8X methylmutase [Candidatus Aerophobetes bacterium]